MAEQVLEQRMPGLAEPERPSVFTSGAVHAVIAAEAGLGRDEVEAGHHVDGEAERPGDPADVAAKPAQDAADFALLLALEDGTFGAQAGDAGRLDEDRFAGAAGAVDDALELVPVVDRHGQDVVVAVDGRVRIAEDLPQLRVAEQAFDLVLHALVQLGQLLADLAQLGAGHVEHVAAAVDAAGDRLGDQSQVLDRSRAGR